MIQLIFDLVLSSFEDLTLTGKGKIRPFSLRFWGLLVLLLIFLVITAFSGLFSVILFAEGDWQPFLGGLLLVGIGLYYGYRLVAVAKSILLILFQD